MTRSIMIAALILMGLNAQAQSEMYGGAGGPYTPMKFVVSDSSIIQTQTDSPEYDTDSSKAQQREHTVSGRTPGIRMYGDSLSTLTGR